MRLSFPPVGLVLLLSCVTSLGPSACDGSAVPASFGQGPEAAPVSIGDSNPAPEGPIYSAPVDGDSEQWGAAVPGMRPNAERQSDAQASHLDATLGQDSGPADSYRTSSRTDTGVDLDLGDFGDLSRAADGGPSVGPDAWDASDAGPLPDTLSSSSDEDLPLAVPLDALLNELAGAFCDPLFQCRLPNAFMIFARAILDWETCRTQAAATLIRGADLVKTIEMGTVIYDAEAASACLTEFSSHCLWSLRALQDPIMTLCLEAFVGTLALNEPCWRSEECAGDAYCAHDNEACPGRCVARRALGEPCAHDHECVQASLGTGVGRCVAQGESRRCVMAGRDPDAELGQSCGLVSDDGAVQRWVDCRDGLWCSSMTQQGVCRQPLPAGAPCESEHTVCEDGHLCLGDELLVCRALTISDTEGLSCSDDAAGPRCNPAKGLSCVEGICQAIGDGSLGAACFMPGFGPTRCDPGLYCDHVSGNCLTLGGQEAPCTADTQCESGQCGAFGACLSRICR